MDIVAFLPVAYQKIYIFIEYNSLNCCYINRVSRWWKLHLWWTVDCLSGSRFAQWLAASALFSMRRKSTRGTSFASHRIELIYFPALLCCIFNISTGWEDGCMHPCYVTLLLFKRSVRLPGLSPILSNRQEYNQEHFSHYTEYLH